MKHKYMSLNGKCESAWAFLCQPFTYNSTRYDPKYKRKNGSYVWRLVDCPTCLKLKEFAGGEGTYITYALRKINEN